jgi:CHASE3 domain sensor protein
MKKKDKLPKEKKEAPRKTDKKYKKLMPNIEDTKLKEILDDIKPLIRLSNTFSDTQFKEYFSNPSSAFLFIKYYFDTKNLYEPTISKKY